MTSRGSPGSPGLPRVFSGGSIGVVRAEMGRVRAEARRGREGRVSREDAKTRRKGAVEQAVLRCGAPAEDSPRRQPWDPRFHEFSAPEGRQIPWPSPSRLRGLVALLPLLSVEGNAGKSREAAKPQRRRGQMDGSRVKGGKPCPSCQPVPAHVGVCLSCVPTRGAEASNVRRFAFLRGMPGTWIVIDERISILEAAVSWTTDSTNSTDGRGWKRGSPRGRSFTLQVCDTSNPGPCLSVLSVQSVVATAFSRFGGSMSF